MTTPAAPLSPAAVAALHRLEQAFPTAVAELHRIESVVAGLRDGESTTINGSQVTAVSLAVAEALTRYETASVRAVQLAALAEADKLSDLDADSLAHAEELMAGARAVLAAAGRLDLIGGV